MATYSGPSVAAAFVTGVFNDSWSAASMKSAEALAMSKDAVGRASNPVLINPPPEIKVPDGVKPPESAPPMTSSEALGIFNSSTLKVTEDLTRGFRDFMERYFGTTPEFNYAREWLQRALTSGGSGIPVSVEAQIYERERSRILGEAARAEEELVSTMAARRFATPPGALNRQLARLNKETNDKLAAAGRDVAIQQATYAIENARIAVSAAIGLRESALNSAQEYVRLLALGPQLGVQLSTALIDAQSKVASTMTSFYQAQVAASEIPVKVGIANAENVVRMSESNQRAAIEAMTQRVNATMAAAQSLGMQAAAALNALHAQAGISANESL